MLFFTKNSIKFSEASRLYLEHCKFEGEMRPESLEQYQKKLSSIMNTLGDVNVKDLNERHIAILKEEYARRGQGPTTRAHTFSILRNLLKFCKTNLMLKVMDSELIKRPKIPRLRVEYLTEEELKHFFDSIGTDTIMNLRFRAFFSVLASTGCRIGEALNLKIDDIDFESKDVTIIGKGNKQRKLYFNDWSVQCIHDYLKVRTDKEPLLFISMNRKRTRWERCDAGRSFRYHLKNTGIDKKVSAHTIRHSFATLLLLKGVGMGHIQALLGHSDIQTTTRHYLGLLSDDECKKAHEKHMDMSSWL